MLRSSYPSTARFSSDHFGQTPSRVLPARRPTGRGTRGMTSVGVTEVLHNRVRSYMPGMYERTRSRDDGGLDEGSGHFGTELCHGLRSAPAQAGEVEVSVRHAD